MGARANTMPRHSSFEPSSVSNMCSTAFPIIVSARCASLMRVEAGAKKRKEEKIMNWIKKCMAKYNIIYIL